MPTKRTSTSEAPAMTQAAIKKLVADSVSAALEAQAANMTNTDNTTRPREAHVAKKCSYKEFMSCQHINFKGVNTNDLKTHVRRFQELATLCPTMMPDSEKMMEVFIGGLRRSIEGNVNASKPQTLEEEKSYYHLPRSLMDQKGRNKGPATGSNLLPVTVTCHAYGEKGHYGKSSAEDHQQHARAGRVLPC
ncbi:hypothetical protein Tco_1377838 [Tanacetum coccineum]